MFFVGPAVDFLLIGGLSILGAIACLALDRADVSFDAVPLAVALGWIVNWPHFAATSFRWAGMITKKTFAAMIVPSITPTWR